MPGYSPDAIYIQMPGYSPDAIYIQKFYIYFNINFIYKWIYIISKSGAIVQLCQTSVIFRISKMSKNKF